VESSTPLGLAVPCMQQRLDLGNITVVEEQETTSVGAGSGWEAALVQAQNIPVAWTQTCLPKPIDCGLCFN
jgi:hypothetical protein